MASRADINPKVLAWARIEAALEQFRLIAEDLGPDSSSSTDRAISERQ
jgi:hypothetical protein